MFTVMSPTEGSYSLEHLEMQSNFKQKSFVMLNAYITFNFNSKVTFELPELTLYVFND